MYIRFLSSCFFKNFILASALFSLVAVGLVAAEPADSQIKGALFDIEKYEQQTTPAYLSNKSSVNRTLRLLKLTRQRLDSSPNKSDPSWVAANNRLEALVARLAAALNPAASPVAVTPSPAPAVPQSQAAAAPLSMISQDRVRIKRLLREIENASQSMDQGGVGVFQDSAQVQKMEQRVQRFRDTLARFDPFATDPDVVAAAEALRVQENMIAFGKDYAAKELSALGDVQAKLRAMEATPLSVPPPPDYPYPGDSLSSWVVELAKVRELAAARVNEIAAIRGKAHLPNNSGTVGQGAPYDSNDLNRLERGYRNAISEIDEGLVVFSRNLDAQVSHVADTLAYFEDLDPAKPSDQANAFLGAGKAKENWERLLQEYQVVSVAAAYSKQLGRAQSAEHSQMLERVKKVADDFKAKQAKALSLARMPEAASEDRELLATAREALSSSDNEVGVIKRMVINADIRQLENETSETEFDDVDISASGDLTMTGTKTTYFYQWEEYQVTTAEPVGDIFFLFYNTLKRYTKGDQTTPLNRWIVAKRSSGIEILEANIDL